MRFKLGFILSFGLWATSVYASDNGTLRNVRPGQLGVLVRGDGSRSILTPGLHIIKPLDSLDAIISSEQQLDLPRSLYFTGDAVGLEVSATLKFVISDPQLALAREAKSATEIKSAVLAQSMVYLEETIHDIDFEAWQAGRNDSGSLQPYFDQKQFIDDLRCLFIQTFNAEIAAGNGIAIASFQVTSLAVSRAVDSGLDHDMRDSGLSERMEEEGSSQELSAVASDAIGMAALDGCEPENGLMQAPRQAYQDKTTLIKSMTQPSLPPVRDKINFTVRVQQVLSKVWTALGDISWSVYEGMRGT